MPIPNQRPELVRRAHMLGHFGINSTLSGLQKQRLWWRGMQRDVELVVFACSQCNRFAPQSVFEHPARSLDIPGVFHRIGMDLVLGLPTTARGNLGVLVITEYLTKWVCIYPIVSKEAVGISRHLLSYCAMFGPPRELLSDQGREFVNTIVQHLVSVLGIVRRVTSPYHPRTDGLTERANQTAIRALERHAAESPEDWDLFLPLVVFAINTRVHSVTGFSAFEMMFGRQPNAWTDYRGSDQIDLSVHEAILQRANELRQLVDHTVPTASKHATFAQSTQRASQDARAGQRLLNNHLPIGSVVYVRNASLVRRKLTPRFTGPYKVHSIAAGGNYVLTTIAGQRLTRSYPLDQLKLISPTVADRVWAAASGDRVYTVDKIVDHRVIDANGHREFLVRWAGFDEEFDSWEPESGILDPDLITAYFSPRPDATSIAAVAI